MDNHDNGNDQDQDVEDAFDQVRKIGENPAAHPGARAAKNALGQQPGAVGLDDTGKLVKRMADGSLQPFQSEPPAG